MTAADYRARLNLSYDPSTYQAQVFDWICQGRGHAVVEAVAGSGKTTTIVAAAKLIAGDGLFVAFNKSIAEMLGQRLQGTTMRASTVHSHGFACVRANVRGKPVVNAAKYKDMVAGAREAAEGRGSVAGLRLSLKEQEIIREDGFPTRACERLIDLARLALVDKDNDETFSADVLALAFRHDLDFDPALEDLVVHVVRNCLWRGADTTTELDFTDMVWLPTVYGWRPARYSWVFVDECQDISKAALALIRRSIRDGGRMMFVGDRRQSIYGFAGADAESFQNIISECEATVLPLSVCYRCPTAVLDVARQWCPQIEARADAPAGAIRKASQADYVGEAREGDLVLSRRNAPLLGLCFDLIAEGIPAVVRGRDIAAGLSKIVDKAAKHRSWSDFLGGLAVWEDTHIAITIRRSRDADAAAERCNVIRDQAEALRIIHARSKADSVAALKRAIDDLFSDERGAVTLSSVHRAKGLESHRVAIVDAEVFPYPARQAWQDEQEINIAYVAWTRAIDEVIELT